MKFDNFNIKKGTPLKFYSSVLQREVDLEKEGERTIKRLIEKGDNRFSVKQKSSSKSKK